MLVAYLSCGDCVACRNGKPNCCVRIAVLGVHRDGGMCERISIPESNLYSANALSIDQAASIEFLAIGAHAVRRSALREGMKALVIGTGPIGLGVAIFADLAGGAVTVMDRDAERLFLASTTISVANTMLAGDDAPASVAEVAGGDGFDVVFDATGNRASMEGAFTYVAHGGGLILVSVVSGSIAFSDPEFHKREMTLKATRNALRWDFEHVMTAVGEGKPLRRRLSASRKNANVSRNYSR
jgi:threonine dehydrogenase-like Zn-dependent dehydrogenase